MERHQ
jgi:uncharacterized radical SAM superfamily protein